jgi:hypothetical protein
MNYCIITFIPLAMLNIVPYTSPLLHFLIGTMEDTKVNKRAGTNLLFIEKKNGCPEK